MILLTLLWFVVSLHLQSHLALGGVTNITPLSICASDQQVELFSLADIEAAFIERYGNTSNLQLVSDGTDNLFSANCVLGDLNVIGSANVFVETRTGQFFDAGMGNTVGCSLLGAGNAFPVVHEHISTFSCNP